MHEITVLDGFNRFKREKKMTDTSRIFNRFGTGASAGTRTNLQGYNRILQGYMQGTREDREDWRFLVDIEHPVVLQGFENWISQPLQGKAKRQERREKRQEKKAEKKEQKAEKKENRQETRTARKDKREQRRDMADQRKERRKETKTAKKEERLVKKIERREDRGENKQARRDRKQQRLDDRKFNKTERREMRGDRQQDRQDRRADRQERFVDMIGEVGAPLVQDLVRGGGVFEEYSFGEIPQNFMPSGVSDFISNLRNMPDEDALEVRDRLAEDLGEDAGGVGSDSGISPTMLMVLGGGALALLAMSKSGRKKK